jgi:hypothetical protein
MIPTNPTPAMVDKLSDIEVKEWIKEIKATTYRDHFGATYHKSGLIKKPVKFQRQILKKMFEQDKQWE